MNDATQILGFVIWQDLPRVVYRMSSVVQCCSSYGRLKYCQGKNSSIHYPILELISSYVRLHFYRTLHGRRFTEANHMISLCCRTSRNYCATSRIYSADPGSTGGSGVGARLRAWSVDFMRLFRCKKTFNLDCPDGFCPLPAGHAARTQLPVD